MVVIYTLAETQPRKPQVCILLPPNGRQKESIKSIIKRPQKGGLVFSLN